MEPLLVLVLSGLLVSVVADVWYYVLIQPDHIFGFVARWVNEIEESFDTIEAKERFRYWMKPLVGCNRCIAGQLALWLYIASWDYNFWAHIAFVCVAIFGAVLFERVFK